MTEEDIEKLKIELRQEVREEVRSNFSWMKWVFVIIIGLLTGFETNNVYNTREISKIKQEFVTKDDNEKLKLEISIKFSLPVQLMMAKLDQVNATMKKSDLDFKKAQEEEKRIVNEMIKLQYVLSTRGGN